MRVKKITKPTVYFPLVFAVLQMSLERESKLLPPTKLIKSYIHIELGMSWLQPQMDAYEWYIDVVGSTVNAIETLEWQCAKRGVLRTTESLKIDVEVGTYSARNHINLVDRGRERQGKNACCIPSESLDVVFILNK